jgi:hypothetical protein
MARSRRSRKAWIGGDADSFAEKVVTKLLPAIAELIAAIAGINLNLTDATSAVDEADQKIQILRATAFFSFGTTAALANYLDVIKQKVQKLSAACVYFSQNLARHRRPPEGRCRGQALL